MRRRGEQPQRLPGARPRHRVGALTLRIPKLRTGSFFPEDMIERHRRVGRALVVAVAEMYATGQAVLLMMRQIRCRLTVTPDLSRGAFILREPYRPLLAAVVASAWSGTSTLRRRGACTQLIWGSGPRWPLWPSLSSAYQCCFLKTSTSIRSLRLSRSSSRIRFCSGVRLSAARGEPGYRQDSLLMFTKKWSK